MDAEELQTILEAARHAAAQGPSSTVPASDWSVLYGPALLAALDAVTAERDRLRAAMDTTPAGSALALLTYLHDRGLGLVTAQGAPVDPADYVGLVSAWAADTDPAAGGETC